MSEIKLNEWRWGVVPRLSEDAAIIIGDNTFCGDNSDPISVLYRYLGSTHSKQVERWYAVLSLGPPTMPEPELRLPAGWKVTMDSNFEVINGHHIISVEKMDADLRVFCNTVVRGATRRECIERINEILGGGK